MKTHVFETAIIGKRRPLGKNGFHHELKEHFELMLSKKNLNISKLHNRVFSLEKTGISENRENSRRHKKTTCHNFLVRLRIFLRKRSWSSDYFCVNHTLFTNSSSNNAPGSEIGAVVAFCGAAVALTKWSLYLRNYCLDANKTLKNELPVCLLINKAHQT